MKTSKLIFASAVLFAGLVLSLLSVLPARAADAELFGVFKGQVFTQDDPVGPRLIDFEEPLFFEAFVEPSSSNSITRATLGVAGGAAITLTPAEPPELEFKEQCLILKRNTTSRLTSINSLPMVITRSLSTRFTTERKP
jgi:hypothetical protein